MNQLPETKDEKDYVDSYREEFIEMFNTEKKHNKDLSRKFTFACVSEGAAHFELITDSTHYKFEVIDYHFYFTNEWNISSFLLSKTSMWLRFVMNDLKDKSLNDGSEIINFRGYHALEHIRNVINSN